MNVNYYLKGNGKETVMFLHGWGGDTNSFNFFSNALSNSYQTCLIDFVGFGKSEKLKYEFSVFDYAVQIFKFIKSKEIDNLIIICHSFGARVAILLNAWFNVKINKLVIIGGAGIKPRFNIITYFKIYKYKLLKFLNKKEIIKVNLKNYGSSDYQALNDVEKISFKKIVGFNQIQMLQEVRIPTLLIWGERDKSTPTYMAKIFNKKIKNSELKIIKNANHFCFLSHKNLVLFYINNFLESK